jgi:hypothetical protein
MVNNMVSIYILEKNNIPFYVGKAKDIIRRKNRHKQAYGYDIDLYVIDNVEEKNWKFWECYWIEQFRQWGFDLLNKNKGGGGPNKHREEIKQKMKKPRKKGTGNKISKTLKERNHSQYYTQEVKEKISKGNQIPKPFTEEHIKNMGIAKRKQATPVLQYDLENNFIKEWESKGQAALWIKEQTGKTSNLVSQIKDCILGRQKTAFGYKWKYK